MYTDFVEWYFILYNHVFVIWPFNMFLVHVNVCDFADKMVIVVEINLIWFDVVGRGSETQHKMTWLSILWVEILLHVRLDKSDRWYTYVYCFYLIFSLPYMTEISVVTRQWT